MRQPFIQRPQGPWTFVRHQDEAHYTAEAVLEVNIAVGRKAHQPAEIRLNDEDLERLFDLPELRELLRRRLFGELPSRVEQLAETETLQFQEELLARAERLLVICPEAFAELFKRPAVQALLEEVQKQEL